MNFEETITSEINQSFIKKIIKCQSFIRGHLLRKKRLPNALYSIQNHLKKNTINMCKTTDDGRINSCMDEDEIIKILLETYSNRIFKPKARMWYDILVKDFQYGMLPVNIKSTTTLTSDNTGNLAMCVHAYTNQELHLYESYQNGQMSKILIEKLNQKEFNLQSKKDYYFIVVNKTNCDDIIVNSVKGLVDLTPNINNLPFQIMWNKNRNFTYQKIEKNIKQLLDAFQKPKPSWKETFMNNIRTIQM